MSGFSGPVVIGPPKGVLGVDFREMWAYRYLFLRMLIRPIKVRYKQTLLGVAWALLRPLVTVLVFTVFFGRLLRVEEHVALPYALFVLAGLLPWNLTASTVAAAAASTVDQAHLITKVYFPRLFLPASVLGWTGLDFAVGMAVLAGVMAWYGVVPGPAALLLPAVLALMVCCALGLGALLAALNVRYRDFGHAVPFMVQTWLFLTPVIYPSTVVPERFRSLAALNPMTGLVTAFRSCLLGGGMDWAGLGTAAAVCLLLLAGGAWYFSRVEDFFADVV